MPAHVVESAIVDPTAAIGEGTRIWHHVQVRERAQVGRNCIVGKGAFIDCDVVIGDNVKIQNGALVYHGTVIEDGVFIGPAAVLTNDRVPRAINPDGTLKGDEDWRVGRIVVKYGASIGAGATIVTDVEIGRFALVGAGAVVTKDVPAHALVVGVPARHVGYACACGCRLEPGPADEWRCSKCSTRYDLPPVGGAASGPTAG